MVKARYRHNGFTEEAVDLLKVIDSRVAYPTVRMYLAYLADEAGDKTGAKKYYDAALALPSDYCNMFRLETINVLEKAKEYAPDNDKIYYYLGNLFYDKQPDTAMANWQKCVEINPDFALAWRNLGWGYWLHAHDLNQSAECYRKAIQLAPDQALFLEEIDQVYELKGEDVKVRYDLLKSHHQTGIKRYYPLAAEVITGTFVGDYDYVLDLLKNCYFPTREGVANFHDIYVDALMMTAQDKVTKGKYTEAIALFEQCFEYPDNHQVFLVDKRVPRDAQSYYFLGETCEKMGNKSKATFHYKKASAVDVKKTDYRFWQGLALQKLGKTAEAKALFENLLETGRKGIVENVINFYGAEGTTGNTVASVNTKAYYTLGLGQLGLDQKSEANKSFQKSVELKRDNLWANFMEAQTQ
ncbi:MAG: tetratricopeptide repeat protein [Candidatus Symbiothrix sp.]|jgi:tetratricopeptide (TPR) repeat protein|nr:tetratricopeptide repeat protein [Candidatus Symbiothrix sp.]